MMSKTELIEEARGLGLEVSQKNTIAEIEKMIARTHEVTITASMNTIYVRRGEEKTVPLTPEIQVLIDAGRLQVIE
jgi:hypothetical protein